MSGARFSITSTVRTNQRSRVASEPIAERRDRIAREERLLADVQRERARDHGVGIERPDRVDERGGGGRARARRDVDEVLRRVAEANRGERGATNPPARVAE